MLALLLISQVGFSQNMNELFNTFADREDVTHITVGPIMMKLGSLFTKTMGVKSIEVLELSECNQQAKDDLVKAIKELKDPHFETLVTANEPDSRTKVLVRIDKKVIRELIVLTTGNDNALIRIKGKIKPEDIDKIVEDHRDGC